MTDALIAPAVAGRQSEPGRHARRIFCNERTSGHLVEPGGTRGCPLASEWDSDVRTEASIDGMAGVLFAGLIPGRSADAGWVAYAYRNKIRLRNTSCPSMD